MEKVKPKARIEVEFPHFLPKIYEFTGEFSKQTLGCYKASRNKKIMYAPIYKSNDGTIIIDMTQLYKPKEIERK